MNRGAPETVTASRWAVAIALAIVLALFFAAVTGAQVTAAGQGQRILRRAVATTTDLDAGLPKIESDLHKAAPDSGSDVQVPDFPIAVDITQSDAGTIGGEELRMRILDQAAQRLYSDGASAWTSGDSSAQQSIRRISNAGVLKTSLGLVRDKTHKFFVILAVVLGLIALGLAAALAFGFRTTYTRLVALGGVTLAAALPSLAVAAAVWIGFRVAESGHDQFTKGMLGLGADVAWVAVRDYLALSALGAAIVAVTTAFRSWDRRARVRAASRAGLMH